MLVTFHEVDSLTHLVYVDGKMWGKLWCTREQLCDQGEFQTISESWSFIDAATHTRNRLGEVDLSTAKTKVTDFLNQ